MTQLHPPRYTALTSQTNFQQVVTEPLKTSPLPFFIGPYTYRSGPILPPQFTLSPGASRKVLLAPPRFYPPHRFSFFGPLLSPPCPTQTDPPLTCRHSPVYSSKATVLPRIKISIPPLLLPKYPQSTTPMVSPYPHPWSPIPSLKLVPTVLLLYDEFMVQGVTDGIGNVGALFTFFLTISPQNPWPDTLHQRSPPQLPSLGGHLWGTNSFFSSSPLLNP